jgi:hypothetical protein
MQPSVMANGAQSILAPAGSQSPKLLDRLRQALLQHRYQPQAVERFVQWNRDLIVFHQLRHPETFSAEDVQRFLLAVAARHGNQGEAAHAVAFLFREVLRRQLPLPVVGRWRGGQAADEPAKPPRLLDRVREVLRVRGYARRTEECYVQWIVRYIRFHDTRHPLELGGGHIERFLTDLAVRGEVSASTQTQALHALLFLYQQVLEVELPLIRAVRSKRPRRLPVVMSRGEVRRVLEAIDGFDGLYALMARLLNYRAIRARGVSGGITRTRTLCSAP